MMITIAVIALIVVIGSMSIVDTNSNAFAKSSHHGHHGDKKREWPTWMHYQKHVCIDDRHESSGVQQEEIILSSPGLPQQQLYLNRIPAGSNPWPHRLKQHWCCSPLVTLCWKLVLGCSFFVLALFGINRHKKCNLILWLFIFWRGSYKII